MTESVDSAGGRLRVLEEVIARGLDAYLEVGRALAAIRAEQLYLVVAETWEAYTAARWGICSSQAKLLVRVAEVAGVIEAHGCVVPAGTSCNALHVLSRALGRRQSSEAARVWALVVAGHGGRRPINAGDVRAVLEAEGLVEPAAQRVPLVQVSQVARSAASLAGRVALLSRERGGRVLPRVQRAAAVEAARQAREAAETLERLANVRGAEARLLEVERPGRDALPLAEYELCMEHLTAPRDERGVCLACRRPDVAGRRPLVAA